MPPPNPNAEKARQAMREYLGVIEPNKRPPLTLLPDEVLQGGWTVAEDNTLTKFDPAMTMLVYSGNRAGSREAGSLREKEMRG